MCQFRHYCINVASLLELWHFFFIWQKIENLKETTCVSETPSYRLHSDLLVASPACDWLLLPSPFAEHGRVHQALHRTAADRQGKHGCAPSVSSRNLTRHPNYYPPGTVPVCTLGALPAAGLWCGYLLWVAVAVEGVADSVSSHVSVRPSNLEKQSSLLYLFFCAKANTLSQQNVF